MVIQVKADGEYGTEYPLEAFPLQGDMDKAKDAAKHKILQDIVKVRVLNESRYTDITKISAEFDKPLKEGKVISQKQVDNGVIIYYQIRDTGLKEKFEKK